jgi:hypothetical protein
MISMLGPTRVSESSDTGLHDNLRFNVTGSYPLSQVIQLHQVLNREWTAVLLQEPGLAPRGFQD